MRTTLNIDLHIHRELAEYAAEKGLSLSAAASYLLATGLKQEAEAPQLGQAIERPAWRLGTIGPAGVDLSDWQAVKEFFLAEDIEHSLGNWDHGDGPGSERQSA